MKVVDQLGRQIEINDTPQRVVSVVPSQTEYLYDLGLGNNIVGQTLFCVHPENRFKNAVKVGGTKKLNLDKIRELKPDIIIANKEENEHSQILKLEKEFPVWISDIKTMDDALDMMLELGSIFGKVMEADNIISQINTALAKGMPQQKIRKTLYLIWREPWMAAGRDTFVNHMMQYAGFDNVLEDSGSRYPDLSDMEIRKLDPEYVLLSSEPYPFKEIHVQELRKLLPQSHIVLVDGEMFSWYGSRLVQAFPYLQTFAEN